MRLLGFTLLAVLFGSTNGCGSDSPPPNEPPTITCPKVNTSFIAGEKKNSVEVKWKSPTTSDPENGPVTTRLKSTKRSGSSFEQGRHTVLYEAEDSGGLRDFCIFKFTVNVIQCKAVTQLRNGKLTCEGRNYGHTCSFTCYEGYKLVGNKDIKCLMSGRWNDSIPECKAKMCDELRKPANSNGFFCTNGRQYKSTCLLMCIERNGYTPVKRLTRCRVDQTWTTPNMSCRDIEAPQIQNCPTQTLVKFKDPRSNQTEVKWGKPLTVKDNSGDELEVTAIGANATKDSGVFNEGTTLVHFTAMDKANNIAPTCSIFVRIETLRCDPPKLDDKYLETPNCLGFLEEQSCYLQCYLALQLMGPRYITCKRNNTSSHQSKGYWSYPQNDTSKPEKPYCKVHNCTELRVPNFGAISCDKWELGRYCSIACKNGYDIPESEVLPSPVYYCQRKTGTWNNDIVPDCAWRQPGERIRMKAYYYFTGICSASKDKIKRNFLTVIEKSNACPSKKYCTVENVKVTCGDEPDEGWMRKRSLRYTRSYIKFEVNVPADKTVPFNESLDKGRKEVTKYALDISHVSFNISSTRRITPRYFKKTAAVPVCKPGLKLGLFHRDSCVPCPSGSFHNVTQDECVACPLGQFQNLEGQSACQLCPSGTTTITVANNETTACRAMCLPGTFSLSGVLPCGNCPAGTYTPNVNMTLCTPCPTGMTTEEEGADSVAKCLPFDIMLQGPVSTPLEGKTPVQICDFTFAVWIKTVEEASDGVRFEISNPVDGVGLQIEISTAIEVTLNGEHIVRADNVLDTKWNHVAVIWSEQTMKVYKNNAVVKTQSLPGARKCPSSTDSSMQVAIRNYAYVYLRDLNFLEKAKPSIFGDMTKTCSSYLAGSLFALEQMDIQSNDRIMEVLPSSCLRPDPCDPNPCGDSVCIPGKDNVTCACKRGYTGPKCENPPDYCKDNICMNNATCYVSDGFACSCPPGFAGKLCERKIADGGWSDWYDWSECSTSCGQGVQTRMRFCTNPPPDADGKPCPGSDRQTQPCNDAECPVCKESTLVLGKGVMKTCTKSEENITCTIECQLGKVLPERPFDYVCSLGFWTPTQQTLSCTDPVTPIVTGINYTVVYGNDLTSQSEVQTSLNRVGHDFTCARNSTCDLEVGSSACSQHVPVCHKYGGTYYGSLIVKKGVPQAPIKVVDIQQNDSPFIKPLFDTWNVFAHTSDELVTPTHRPLEMEIVGDQLEVFPYNHPRAAITVPGQFGEIMKTWKVLDNINWEVRNANYTTFKATTTSGARKPLFLSAVQMMTCPPGAITGGVFCMKCPPGKYYVNEECKWCTNGLYQDLPGQFDCKVCPAFQTTEVKGSSDVSQCIDTDVSELHILLGMTSPNIGVLDMTDLKYRQMSMTPTLTGNVDYMAYNPKDKTIFFSTQYPSTIVTVEYSGQNMLELMTFPDGTVVTGLDVDIGSNLLFYMTNQGLLAAYHIVTGAQWTMLSDLPSSDGLVLDQEFGIYWMETATIKYMHYGDETPRTLYTDTHTIWGLSIDYQDKRLMWQSANRLRSSNMDGSNPQTLSLRFSSRFGATDEYFFTITKEGNTQRLMRENRDRTAFVSVHVVPPSTSRMKVINNTIPNTVDQPCLPSHSDCQQACLPLNTTARLCFCRPDFTLQSDLMYCRRDFSVDFETTNPTLWYRPTLKDYSIPPSKTLRFNVKACHSAKMGLAKTGRELYVLRIDNHINNKIRIDLIKHSPSKPEVLLQEKDISLLDCNGFKTFWITWKKDEARRTQALKVGYGSVVGSNMLLNVADAFPYTVNFLQFGVGINGTAHWQI